MKLGFRIPVVRTQLVREKTVTVENKVIRGVDDAYEILRQYLGEGADREHVIVMMLDTKHRVLAINTVSIGSLDASIVHPREVFKPAVVLGASGILVAHNHPSGDTTPSPEDRDVTRRIVEAGKILGIDVLDHIVFGDFGYASMKAMKYM